MSASSEADAATRALAEAARAFAAQKLQRNVSGFYARALRRLVDAARAFARKSDEEWAAEVAAALKRVTALEGALDRALVYIDEFASAGNLHAASDLPKMRAARERPEVVG